MEEAGKRMNTGGSSGIHKNQAIFRSFDHKGDAIDQMTHFPLMSEGADVRSDHEIQQSALHRSYDSKGNPKLVLYSYRWIVLLVFAMATAASGMLSATCITIASLVSKSYNLSTLEANFLNLIYYAAYIPGNFFALWIINRYGLRTSCIIGAMLTMIGSWIRLFIIFTNFSSFFIGSAISGIGQPFLMNAPSKVASNWFGDKERGIATAIGGMAGTIGFIVSFTLPQAIITGNEDIDEGRTHFCLYVFIQTLIGSALCIPCMVFLREDPPSPPSVVANDTNGISLKEGMKELISNKNYLLLYTIFVFVFSINSSTSSIYSNFASQFGFTLQDTSVACLIYLISGVFNSIFLGTVLDKYQNYKKMTIGICISSIIAVTVHYGTLKSGNLIMESFGMLLLGASNVPILSIAQAFAVELAFPVPEALTNGFMLTTQMLAGTVLGVLNSKLSDISTNYPFFVWIFLGITGLVLSFFVDQDLRRLYLDDVKNSEYIEDGDLRKQSFEQREAFLKESGLHGDLKFKFEFDIDKQSSRKVNESHTIHDSHSYTRSNQH